MIKRIQLFLSHILQKKSPNVGTGAKNNSENLGNKNFKFIFKEKNIINKLK